MMVEVILFNTPHVQGDTTVDWTGYDGGSNVNSFCGKNVSLTDVAVYTGTVNNLLIKQDIRIYHPFTRPNSWTEWAVIF